MKQEQNSVRTAEQKHDGAICKNVTLLLLSVILILIFRSSYLSGSLGPALPFSFSFKIVVEIMTLTWNCGLFVF